MCQLVSGGINRKCALISQTAESWGRGCVRGQASATNNNDIQQHPTWILTLSDEESFLYSQIYQVLFHQILMVLMESERDGEGLVLQEEQGHCTLFFHSLTHFLLHTHTLLPWSCSGTKTCTDTHTDHIIWVEKAYVMVNKMKHGWREREQCALSIST